MLKRLLLLTFLLPSIMTAYVYHRPMMKITAKMGPALAYLSLEGTLPQKRILLTVAYEEGEKHQADLLIEQMRKNYPKGLKNFRFAWQSSAMNDLETLKKSNFIILLKGSRAKIRTLLATAKEHDIPTLSYDYRGLADGAVFAIKVDQSVKTFMNMKIAKEVGIVPGKLLPSIIEPYSGAGQ